jgi:fructose-1,6-bisphosphatase/inositol monophosphatase family enzyme
VVEPVIEPTDGKAFDEELAFAHELADLAGEIGLAYFRGSFEVTIKPDRTPVTEADLSIESAIRDAVGRRYPRDSVLGEEGGLQARADGDGSSIRSTGRRTSPTASRSGPT